MSISIERLVQGNLIELAARNLLGGGMQTTPSGYTYGIELAQTEGYLIWNPSGLIPPNDYSISFSGVRCPWPTNCYVYRRQSYSDSEIQWLEVDAVPLQLGTGFKLFQYQFQNQYPGNTNTERGIIYSGILRTTKNVSYDDAGFYPSLTYPNVGATDIESHERFFSIPIPTNLTRVLLPNGCNTFVGNQSDQFYGFNNTFETNSFNLLISSLFSTYKHILNSSHIVPSNDPISGVYAKFGQLMIRRLMEYINGYLYVPGIGSESDRYTDSFSGTIIPDIENHFTGNIKIGLRTIRERDAYGLADITRTTEEFPYLEGEDLVVGSNPDDWINPINWPVYSTTLNRGGRNQSTFVIGSYVHTFSPSVERNINYAFWIEGSAFFDSGYQPFGTNIANGENIVGRFPVIFRPNNDGLRDEVRNLPNIFVDSYRTILSSNLARYCSYITI